MPLCTGLGQMGLIRCPGSLRALAVVDLVAAQWTCNAAGVRMAPTLGCCCAVVLVLASTGWWLVGWTLYHWLPGS